MDDKAQVAATELIYLNVKPTVKPEDVDSDAGRAFLESIKQLRLQPHCHSVVWGRSFEDPSFTTVVTRWTATGTRVPAGHFTAHELEATLDDQVFYFEFDAGDLTSYPTTEIALPTFPSNLPRSEICEELMKPLLATLFQFEDPNIRALKGASGLVSHPDDRPSTASPTGREIVFASIAGWPSVEAHQAALETDELKKAIGFLMTKMLGFPQGIHMMHFVFRG